MKIVLAIDGSDFSKVAVDELAAMSLPPNTEVLIVSVFDNSVLIAPGSVSVGGSMGNYYEKAASSARKSADGIVKEAARLLEEKNTSLSVTTTVVNGFPKIAILEEAEAFGADLIVIGSKGQGAMSRFLLGSVTQSVALRADCSVMIVRNSSTKRIYKR